MNWIVITDGMIVPPGSPVKEDNGDFFHGDVDDDGLPPSEEACGGATAHISNGALTWTCDIQGTCAGNCQPVSTATPEGPGDYTIECVCYTV